MSADVSLLIVVQRYLDRTGLTATALGLSALGDPRFVHDLRDGRNPRGKTQARLLAYMADNPGPAGTAVSRKQREAEEGRAYALAWRARRKPYFDALYGPDEWASDPDLKPATWSKQPAWEKKLRRSTGKPYVSILWTKSDDHPLNYAGAIPQSSCDQPPAEIAWTISN